LLIQKFLEDQLLFFEETLGGLLFAGSSKMGRDWEKKNRKIWVGAWFGQGQKIWAILPKGVTQATPHFFSIF